MLKGVPAVISPDLMKTLLEMGHGDEIVIADGNFPAQSQGVPVIRAAGIGVPEILKAIMKFFPLDKYDDPVILMAPVEGDVVNFPDGKPPIWREYEKIVKEAEGDWVTLKPIERFAFYNRSKKTFAVVATSESAVYANIILKKGVIPPQL